MEMETIEKKQMNREQYLKKRNDSRGVDAEIIYSFYLKVCKEKGMNPHPITTFIQALQLHPNSNQLVQQALEYYDTSLGIIEMSIMKDGSREVIKYI